MQVMLSCTHGEVGVVVAQILNLCNYKDFLSFNMETNIVINGGSAKWS